MSSSGAEPQPLDLSGGGPPAKPTRPVFLPRRVRRRRTRGTSLSTTVAQQVQWSVQRPAGRRLGSRGDDLRPRRRAKHAGSPFGVQHRFAVGVATVAFLACGALLVAGSLVCHPRSTLLLAAGTAALIVGAALGTSLAWGRPFRSLHGKTDRGRERRLRLRGMLERQAAGLELVARVDEGIDRAWVTEQCAVRTDEARRLIEAALGPPVALEFSGSVAVEHRPGRTAEQSDADAKAFFVRYLIAYLDKYPVQDDWEPDHDLSAS